MNVFWERGQIEDWLSWAFKQRYKHKDVALTGILLARPEDSLTRDEILPHLDFWNYRSDYYTDFFCVGYLPQGITNSEPALRPVATVDGMEWVFSRRAFVDLLEDIERTAGLKYDGSPWLLLMNSYFDGDHARLDYSRIVWVNFREAIADGAVSTPTQLAEYVFQFAKSVNERPHGSKDPAWEVSDDLGRKVLKRGLKEALISVLPDWLKPSVRQAVHFAIRQA